MTPQQMLAQTKPKPNGCILWTGYIDKYGYGRVKYKGENRPAHHVMLAISRPPPEEGLHALHNRECSNRNCINPAHLHWGTNADNSHERSVWGYKPHSDELMTAVQKAALKGDKSQRQIAKEFGVSQTQVSRFKRGFRSHWNR